MSTQSSQDVQFFLRAAFQRFEDAQFLLHGGRTTGAIYLAGYAIECSLKALLLSSVTVGKRKETIASFRGSKAHDYEWLKVKYIKNGGSDFPLDIAKLLAFANSWNTDLRYESGKRTLREAVQFLHAA